MNNSNRVGPEGYASTPLSYNITSARLYSNVINPKKKYNIDIKALLAVIEGTESIHSPGVEYTIKLGDSVNLLERLKISGGEKIEIQLEQRLKDKTHKHSITCYIGEIINFKKSGAAKASYTLKCYGEHMMNESVSILNKSFKGTSGQLIEKICRGDLAVATHFIQQGGGLLQGIYPQLRPLHAIFWIMRNAFDDGTPFFFYETLKNGIQFRSYKNMLTRDNIDKYYFKSFMKNAKESAEGFEEERTMVTDISSPSYGMSKMVGAASGAFASTLHNVDIATKTYRKIVFDRERQQLNMLNKHKPYVQNNNSMILSRKYSDHAVSKQFFINSNSKAFGQNNYYGETDIDLNKGIAQLENLNFQTQEITIPGNFDMEVGRILHLTVYRNKEETEGAGIDKAQSGKYLVTRVTHRFDDSYSQELVLQKDSGELNYETT